MEVINVAYCRRCTLDDSLGFDYHCNANGIADQIYERLIRAVPGIRRVDTLISEEIWKPSGKTIPVIRFLIDNRIPMVVQLDECFQLGEAFMTRLLISHIQSLNK